MTRVIDRLTRVLLVTLLSIPAWAAAAGPSSQSASGSPPLEVKADRIDYLQEQDIYEADGSVVIDQGSVHLTADHVTIQALPGVMIATGHVRLTDPKADVVGERLELNVNTEAGVVTHGEVYVKASNTTVDGRLIQRFSEDHYRFKEGRFTNCDAPEGETPAWRFRFKDLDLNAGDSLAFKGSWFCVADVPVIPFPTMTYPLSPRESGFLIPTPGYDNRFGLHYQQGYYWAISPSQDLTISPQYYSRLGYGSDFEYRYMLNRASRGQWFVSYLQQTSLPNVSGVTDTGQTSKEARALITGTHTQLLTPDLLLRVNANLVTDPQYLQQLSNSGAQRALPSNESNFLTNQRLRYGNAYVLGQYLQPLQAGGSDTFQRLPEIGYNQPNITLFNTPLMFGGDADAVNFFREEGFTENRVNIVPGLSTDVMDIAHIVGFTPQAKFREVWYSRGAVDTSSQHRETFWAALDARSKMSRRFTMADGDAMLHTIEPGIIYEYVPATDQSKLAQIDQVDDLPKKNLLTYMVKSRLLEQDGNKSFNWLDLTLAQSYHVDGVQTQARDFTPGVVPPLGTVTQPLQPATVPIDGKKFSDLWLRTVIGNNEPQLNVAQLGPAFGRGAGDVSLVKPPLNRYVIIDAFFDAYTPTMTQFNTDFRLQRANEWYLEVGQRYAREGTRPRRGDLWNPISFNEVFAPTQEIEFLTAGGAFRTPFGWLIGAKGYYDIKNGKSPEYDLVALYQNPCKCWSLGLFYLQFPDRAQYNFMFSLTGIGWTENYGTNVVKQVLSPLTWGEKGLPWASPGGHYGYLETPQQQPRAGVPR
ncbi:MAG TPA: LPS assembly protein LptD [Nitrospira sp.]|nr:LPS assembly protein LptD [Nitrospira sp.]